MKSSSEASEATRESGLGIVGTGRGTALTKRQRRTVTRSLKGRETSQKLVDFAKAEP
jgi:hypothetical protein